MIRRLRKYICFAMFLLMFVICGTSALAKDNSIDIKSNDIPKEAINYANEIAPIMLIDVLEKPEIFKIDISEYENWRIGKPFTVFVCDNNKLEDSEIYYFPIMQYEKIIVILSIFKSNEDWSASLSSAMVDKLNELSGEYILFAEDQTVYAENEKETIILEQDHDNSYKSDILEKSYEDKENILSNIYDSFEEKNIVSVLDNNIVGKQLAKIQNKEKMKKILSIALGYTPEFFLNNSTSVSLNASHVGCLSTQRYDGIEYGMCWAACVASTYNYRKGTMLAAFEVCDVMGIGYNDGGTVYDINKGFNRYGINRYTPCLNAVSWQTIKNDINNKYPVIIVAKRNGNNDAHAVTILGYSTKDNTNKVMFWNSGTRAVETLIYSGANSKFSYNGYNYTWVNSVY